MKIHEYQGKTILDDYQISIPKGIPAFSIEDALKAYDSLDSDFVAIKAQIHAGGRGKGGGVKIAKNRTDAENHISNILGMNLVTHQTGPNGKKVERIYLESGVDIESEYYAAITLDRNTEMDVFMVSTEGGVEIEKVASETPDKIIKIWIDPLVGIKTFQLRKLAFGLKLEGATFKEAVDTFRKMYNCYKNTDASLLEINPLVKTKNENIVALDSKFNFDNNALFRQKKILEMRDLSEEDKMEVEANKYNLNYLIAVAAGLGLYLELMIIRLHSSFFQLFGFFKNISLLSCLLGLGVGYLFGHKKLFSLRWVFPLLAIQISFMYLLKSTPIGPLMQNPITEQWAMGLTRAEGFLQFFLIYSFVYTFTLILKL